MYKCIICNTCQLLNLFQICIFHMTHKVTSPQNLILHLTQKPLEIERYRFKGHVRHHPLPYISVYEQLEISNFMFFEMFNNFRNFPKF